MNSLSHVARKAANSPNTSAGKPVLRAKKARKLAPGVIGTGKHASPYAAAASSGAYSGRHRR